MSNRRYYLNIRLVHRGGEWKTWRRNLKAASLTITMKPEGYFSTTPDGASEEAQPMESEPEGVCMNFKVNADLCVRCGICVEDCPSNILVLRENETPEPLSKDAHECIDCRHCLAVCPSGAVSINDVTPTQARLLGSGAFPTPRQLETLIMGRRSMRRFRPENLDAETINRLLGVLAYAPTGVNDRRTRFSVIDDRERMNTFRDKAMTGLIRLTQNGKLPERAEWLGELAKLWVEKRVDGLFRNAPHMIVASSPKDAPCGPTDCVLALAYFELFAHALDVGALWCGLALWTMELLPELRKDLGIPQDHVLGYAMMFGPPRMKYPRAVYREPASIVRVGIG